MHAYTFTCRRCREYLHDCECPPPAEDAGDDDFDEPDTEE